VWVYNTVPTKAAHMPNDTRFKKGNPGRKPGSRNKVTAAIEALLDGEAENLTRKAVELARAYFPSIKSSQLYFCRQIRNDLGLEGFWRQRRVWCYFIKDIKRLLKESRDVSGCHRPSDLLDAERPYSAAPVSAPLYRQHISRCLLL
jgi:hypothetical protein